MVVCTVTATEPSTSNMAVDTAVRLLHLSHVPTSSVLVPPKKNICKHRGSYLKNNSKHNVPSIEQFLHLLVNSLESKQAHSTQPQRSYSCNVCHTSFSDSSSLSRHRRIHTGERPYKCSICSAAFTDKSTLVQHRRTHTGERPYACQHCGAKFSRSGALSAHVRTHTGERPFKCPTCNAAFTQSGHLTVHMRTHTGERPYHCKFCNSSYAQSGSLSKHIRRKHPLEANQQPSRV